MNMDEAARYNIERWGNLVEANALFTRPLLDLTLETAQITVDPEGLFGDISGKKVLCLASGGGQQSAAFGLLGAKVTVIDIAVGQLERDKEAASHYGLQIETIQGDMRDLSAVKSTDFDLVYQPYSLGFVPDASVVFEQVSQVIRPGGIYFFAIGNPFYAGLSQADWNGKGYSLNSHYIEGELVVTPDPEWVYPAGAEELSRKTPEVREYRQTFGKLMNSLLGSGFTLTHFSETKHRFPDSNAEPGTWEHFVSVAPPWLHFWLRYEPD